MDVLDADDEPLKNSSGVQMSRDIVQFVPFRKYRDNAPRLAAELLDEVCCRTFFHLALLDSSTVVKLHEISQDPT